MALLWMVLASSLTAMLLQTLCVRLGVVADKDLAAACRDRYPPAVSRTLWLLAEVAIVACDVAEVLGSALALHLLFGMTILTGVVVTAFDTVVVLALQGRGLRRIQAIVLGLVITIGVCFAIEIVRVGPDWHGVAGGLVPSFALFRDGHAVLLAIGILGATVMPHNLYLHSAIVRGAEPIPEAHRADVLKLSTIDTVVSLAMAFVINAAILVLAASAFHAHGRGDVTEIQDAYLLLDPLVGGAFASVLFRHRAAGIGPELDLHRHHRWPGRPRRLPGTADAVLAASADPRACWRWCRRSSACCGWATTASARCSWAARSCSACSCRSRSGR